MMSTYPSMPCVGSRSSRWPLFVEAGLLFAFLATSAHSGTSSSASYRAISEVIDSGGHSASSSSYAADSSLGAIGALTTSSSLVNRGGFPGQLFEEILGSLELRPPSTLVRENEGLFMTPLALCTDGTRFPLPGTSIAWGQSGPLFVSVSGFAFGSAVYQDTPATVTASRGSTTVYFPVVVLDSINDNYGSYAADGLPDFWQNTYFGLDNPDAAPDADPDHDGGDNLLEYLATTLPTDPNSHLTLSLHQVEDKPSLLEFEFSPYSKERRYSLLASPDLTSPWIPLPDIGETTPDGFSFTFSRGSFPNRFFRLQISE